VTNGREAVSEVHRLDPDVLVIDISMPELDGLHAAAPPQTAQSTKKGIHATATTMPVRMSIRVLAVRNRSGKIRRWPSND
jgi:CheY-like chemotaxis protein